MEETGKVDSEQINRVRAFTEEIKKQEESLQKKVANLTQRNIPIRNCVGRDTRDRTGVLEESKMVEQDATDINTNLYELDKEVKELKMSNINEETLVRLQYLEKHCDEMKDFLGGF